MRSPEIYKWIIYSLAGILQLSLFLSLSFSQPIDLSFNAINEEKGLNSKGVFYFIKQDSKGFIWAGNVDGLHRFDGQSVKVFRPQVDKKIQSDIFEDLGSNLWFTTYSNLHKYDRIKDTIYTFQLENPQGEVLDSYYRAFFLDKNRGKLWLRIGDYICIFNVNDPKEYEFLDVFTKGMWFSVDTTEEGRVKEIWASPWLAGKGIEFFSQGKEGKWNKKEYFHRPIPEFDNIQLEVRNSLIQNDSILWIFSDSALVRLNRRNVSDYQLCRPFLNQKFPSNNGLFISDSQLLIASNTSGLWLINTTNLEFEKNWTSSTNNFKGLLSDEPRGLYKDRQGHIWVTHRNAGLNISMPSMVFDNPIDQLNIEEDVYICSIVEDQNQRIWVATESKGVFVFSLEGNLIKRYGNMVFDFDPRKQLSLDKDGNIWCVTRSACYRYGAQSEWERLNNHSNRQYISLLVTDSGRRLVTATDGLYEIFVKMGNFEIKPIPEFSAFSNWPFRHLFQNSLGQIYIPHQSQELWIYEDEGGLLKRRKSIPIKGLTHAFWEDEKSGIVYLGCENGLLQIDNQLNTAWVFAKTSEFPIEEVFAAIPDVSNRLWLSSSQGIWSYHLGTNQVEQFRKEDGLPSNEFSPFAAIKASDGRLWFGTEKGLCVFSPDKVEPYPYPPKIYIEDLLVNSGPYTSPVQVDESEEILLEYNEHTLAFKLRAIGFYLANLSKIYYSLENYEDGWTFTSNGGTARFTKIPPGDYTLKLKAVNANGIESELKEVSIKILPPFWQKTWFKLLMVLLGVIIVLGSIQTYINQKLRNQKRIIEKQKVRQAERDRIAKDLHDDIGSGLSNIIFLSDSLKPGIDSAKQAKLINISDSARTLVKNLKESIWALDTQNDTIDKLFLQIRSFVHQFLAENELEYELNVPEQFDNRIIAGEKRRNIYLIIKEALHNAVKYADATKFSISFELHENELKCLIMDDGIGLSDSPKKLKGNGLRNMRKRVEDIGGTFIILSKKNEGTTIRFSVPFGRINIS